MSVMKVRRYQYRYLVLWYSTWYQYQELVPTRYRYLVYCRRIGEMEPIYQVYMYTTVLYCRRIEIIIYILVYCRRIEIIYMYS